MPFRAYFNRITDAALGGALILTVNKRLSRHLHSLLDERMRHQGKSVWNTPDILPFEAWLYRSAERLGLDAFLLDRHQALRLWETIIEADLVERGRLLLQIPATAEKAMEAHRLLVAYEAGFSAEEGAEDHRAFLRWRRAWEERCRGGRYLDPARLPEKVVAELSAGRLPAPGRVLLVGFDEVDPEAARALAAFESVGCNVELLPPLCEPTGTATRTPSADPADEVRTCARWAGKLAAEGAERIGVVVAGLERYAPLITRIFREELEPAAIGDWDDEEGVFSLSLGTSLAGEGMIAAALDLLALDRRLSPTQVDFLLRSPFVGGAREEEHSRALLDRERRQVGPETVPLALLARWAREGIRGIGRSSRLSQMLTAFEATSPDRGQRLPGEWAGHFARLLAALGWPGDTPLDSRGYQVLRAWRELIAKFASLDAVSVPMGLGRALSLLRRLAGKEIFQIEGPPGRIQIMGHLEAAGLRFDHLWIMGLHEEALPSVPRPNPFLPLPLQQQRGMPHAGAERELEFARKVASRLLAAAPAIQISHPGQLEGSEARPSPLIRELPVAEPPLAPSRRPTERVRALATPLEKIVDIQAPSLGAGEEVSGGSALLKDQALCPFRAFARHRLAADALATPPRGIDPRTRGLLVHASLDLFWQQTEDSAALHRLDDEERARRIEQCLIEALADFEQGQGQPFPAAWRTIEIDCLRQLLEEWLNLEKRRPPFIVRERETRHHLSVAGLAIRTRVDRIDELTDGTRILLDYKTGRPDFRDCLGDRPLEPQLPLYAVSVTKGAMGAVAFAAVRRGECAFRGVACEENALPSVPPLDRSRIAAEEGIAGWEELLERWRSALKGLGEEFADGLAKVAPVDGDKACGTCELQPLCRVAEMEEGPFGEEIE